MNVDDANDNVYQDISQINPLLDDDTTEVIDAITLNEIDLRELQQFTKVFICFLSLICYIFEFAINEY